MPGADSGILGRDVGKRFDHVHTTFERARALIDQAPTCLPSGRGTDRISKPAMQRCHCTAMERIALVGDKSWEKWMAMGCKPFTMAKIEYFDAADIDKAWAWLREE